MTPDRDHYLNELAQQRAQLEADVQQRLDEYTHAWQALVPLALSEQVVAPLWKGLQQARAEHHLLQNLDAIPLEVSYWSRALGLA
uniref:Uncharacterized protein n=1 Tax=Cyanothece sp. (strain PCC 7425 / ATCC 29141) TaxID=395961 RepID=B8HMU7_CYAP4